MPFNQMAPAITSQHLGSLADPHPRLGQERPSLDSLNSAMSGNLVMDSPPHHGTEPRGNDGSCRQNAEVRVMMPCGSVPDA